MNVYYYDYKFLGFWATALEGTLDAEAASIYELPDVADAILFVHAEGKDLDDCAKWLGTNAGRYVVLIGSGDVPVPRRLTGVDDLETKRWAFCPWSAETFQACNRAEIRAFVESVRQERPDFSLFNPSVEYLTALAILSQGYLIIRANQSSGSPDDPRLESWKLEKGTVFSSGKLTSVRAKSHWNVFNEDRAGVIATAEKEWNGRKGDPQEFERVRELIVAALDENSGPVEDDAVIEAYEAIAGVLERGK